MTERADKQVGTDDEPSARRSEAEGGDRHRSSEASGASRDQERKGRDDDHGEDGAEASDDRKKGQSPLKKPWVRVVLIAVAIILLIAALAYGIYYYTTGRYFQNTNDAYLKADQVQISSQVSGNVARVAVVANQVVEAGAILAKVDDGTYQAKVDQSVAQVAQSRASEASAQANLDKQPAQIKQAEAQLQNAQATLAYAESEVVRYRPLAAAGAETREKLAQLVSQRDQGIAQVALYAAQLEGQRLQVPVLVAQLAQAAGSTQQAIAQLEQARIDLANTVITSSIAGRVGDLTARPGQLVQPGVNLMTIVPVDAFYLEANYKETQVGLMRVGQPVTIKVDALPEQKLRGEVVSFSPGTGSQFSLIPPQNATGNFTKVVQRVPVRIRVDAGQEARKVLVPGLSVIAEVDTRSARDFPERAKEEQRRAGERREKP